MIQVELQETMGSDLSIADSAWTSSSTYQQKKKRSTDDIIRVVNLLADSKHSVPFESIIFRFWMRLPIAIDRQLMTHRIASHSGMSGRYRTMPSDFLKAPDDIYNILLKIYNDDYDQAAKIECEYEELCYKTNNWYKDSLKEFKAAEDRLKISNNEYKRLREFFRGVLPQHNMTERVTIMNLRSWANFYKLRSKFDAQPEIQEIANLMYEQIKQKNICPIAFEALERNEWSI